MKFIIHQTADVGCYRDHSIVRIHRLVFWRWAWIWKKTVTRGLKWQPQVHSHAAELNYIRDHPEIWPPDQDYSAVYAGHSYEPLDKHANAILWDKQNGRDQ